jgi:hypothetical protein
MKQALLIVLMVTVFAPVSAMAGYTYDYKTGNSYSWSSIGDSTYVNGLNARTGSTWQTTITPSGMSGYDSKSNYWQYSNQTGNYYNYGTGKTCMGKGYARTCF